MGLVQNNTSKVKYNSLEEKLTRLQEIYNQIEQKKVNLSQSIPLLEEAYNLKIEIEEELKNIENKLIQLSGQSNINQSSV
jgi:exodeoxyribonuclease VII small subunit